MKILYLDADLINLLDRVHNPGIAVLDRLKSL